MLWVQGSCSEAFHFLVPWKQCQFNIHLPPRGLPLNWGTVSNHASLRNMARHTHSLRVSSWESTLASTTQLVDGLCFRFFFSFFLFLHYIDCRTALLFMSMHFTCSLHSGSCFCMPGIPFVESLKIQAFARNAIRSHIAINTWWADLKATEQAEAVNTHSPSSLHITPPS